MNVITKYLSSDVSSNGDDDDDDDKILILKRQLDMQE